MDTIKNILNNLPLPKYAYGSIEVESIKLAESKLALNFASDYKEFVEYVGAMVYKGHELYGLVSYPSLNVINNTLLAREKDAAFPQKMYVISSLHIDDILILQNEKGEIFQYSPLQYSKKIYNSLAEYIVSL